MESSRHREHALHSIPSRSAPDSSRGTLAAVAQVSSSHPHHGGPVDVHVPALSPRTSCVSRASHGHRLRMGGELRVAGVCCFTVHPKKENLGLLPDGQEMIQSIYLHFGPPKGGIFWSSLPYSVDLGFTKRHSEFPPSSSAFRHLPTASAWWPCLLRSQSPKALCRGAPAEGSLQQPGVFRGVGLPTEPHIQGDAEPLRAREFSSAVEKRTPN